MPLNNPRLYAAVWRWHFYAGLLVLPFILILSVTGSIYLFKPQIDSWEERAYVDLGAKGAVSPDDQLAAAMAANPGASFHAYRLPVHAGDAAMIQLGLSDGGDRDVFVSPQGKVLGSIDPKSRISDLMSRIHGSLLIGKWGDWLVELAASWTIVMLLTGLYLWWPRPFRLAGALYPRVSLKGRHLLKDIHRVTGFWISGLVLVILVSGLPWAGAWGTALQWARTEMRLVQGPQDWKIGEDSAPAHDHRAMVMDMSMPMTMPDGPPLSVFVAKAQAEHMAFPALIRPPHTPLAFGPPTGDEWTAMSEAQNRWLRRQVTYDTTTGVEKARSDFSDQHVIDRVINTGVAWHEGQLFGWVNQLIGLMTAFALMGLSVLGVFMWLKRRPQGAFGAPPLRGDAPTRWIVPIIVVLAFLLPLFGASLVVLAVLDRLIAAWRRPATA